MIKETKAIIVTSANALYFELVQDLIVSLRTQKFNIAFDIGLLDTGMTDEQCQWLKSNNVKIERTKRLASMQNSDELEKEIPGFSTLTEQLFMRDYFPDYDVYLWMDADTWVQTPEAINLMIPLAANTPALLIAPEMDRSYQPFFDNAKIWGRYNDWYVKSYGPDIAGEMSLRPMYNVGIWAMRKDCVGFQLWADTYLGLLKSVAKPSIDHFMAHQLGMNIALHRGEVPCLKLPARYNWLTAFALPLYDKDRHLFLEPSPPYQPISHLHLTRDIKAQNETLQCTDGTTHKCSLIHRAKGRAFDEPV